MAERRRAVRRHPPRPPVSLTNPSIGEYVDRLSILRLKIRGGEAKEISVEHFRTEQCEIMQRMPREVSLVNPYISRLFRINELLWELTDEFRAIASQKYDFNGHQARLGCSILRMNDERAELIAKINAQYGDYRMEKIPG